MKEQQLLSRPLQDRLQAILSPTGGRIPVDLLSVHLGTMDLASSDWHEHVCLWASRAGFDPSSESSCEFTRMVRAFVYQVFSSHIGEVH